MDNAATITLGQFELTITAKALANEAIARAAEACSITCADSPVVTTPPAIGEYWHGQGGVYAGLMRGENDNPDYHLIVPTDPAGYTTDIKWGGYGTKEEGCDSTFDGQANTEALCNSDIKHPAAQWADALEIEGHDDFYLPARRELRLLWVNVPELFADGWYWSSTQYSQDNAWVQNFDGGYQDYGTKYYEGRARAVRRVVAN